MHCLKCLFHLNNNIYQIGTVTFMEIVWKQNGTSENICKKKHIFLVPIWIIHHFKQKNSFFVSLVPFLPGICKGLSPLECLISFFCLHLENIYITIHLTSIYLQKLNPYTLESVRFKVWKRTYQGPKCLKSYSKERYKEMLKKMKKN